MNIVPVVVRCHTNPIIVCVCVPVAATTEMSNTSVSRKLRLPGVRRPALSMRCSGYSSDAVDKAVSIFPYSPLDTNRPQCVAFEGHVRKAKPTSSTSGKAKRSVKKRWRNTQNKNKPKKAGRKQQKKSMRLTASEAWCMLRLLPLILLHAGVSLQELAGSETFAVLCFWCASCKSCQSMQCH